MVVCANLVDSRAQTPLQALLVILEHLFQSGMSFFSHGFGFVLIRDIVSRVTR